MQYNNPKNAAHGAVLKGMGLLPGVSDLAYLRDDGRMLFIEMKLPGQRQSPAQKDWQQIVTALGADYCVITSLEEFQAAIESPDAYLDRLIKQSAPDMEKIEDPEEWLREIRGY